MAQKSQNEGLQKSESKEPERPSQPQSAKWIVRLRRKAYLRLGQKACYASSICSRLLILLKQSKHNSALLYL